MYWAVMCLLASVHRDGRDALHGLPRDREGRGPEDREDVRGAGQGSLSANTCLQRPLNRSARCVESGGRRHGQGQVPSHRSVSAYDKRAVATLSTRAGPSPTEVGSLTQYPSPPTNSESTVHERSPRRRVSQLDPHDPACVGQPPLGRELGICLLVAGTATVEARHFESLKVRLDGVDLLGNVASFTELNDERPVSLPLDQIQTVWRKTKKGENELGESRSWAVCTSPTTSGSSGRWPDPWASAAEPAAGADGPGSLAVLGSPARGRPAGRSASKWGRAGMIEGGRPARRRLAPNAPQPFEAFTHELRLSR